jgi:hypothetical protein
MPAQLSSQLFGSALADRGGTLPERSSILAAVLRFAPSLRRGKMFRVFSIFPVVTVFTVGV